MISKCVLSAIGKDKAGIVSEVTGVLYRHRCSIEDSSMTILEGNFTMILIVALAPKVSLRSFERDFRTLEKKLGLLISFQALKSKPQVGPFIHRGRPHILSVLGSDRPGIVYRVAKILARRKINITDLNTKVIGREGDKNAYAMVIEVEIPPAVSTAAIEKDLKVLGRSLRAEVSLKPIESLNL